MAPFSQRLEPPRNPGRFNSIESPQIPEPDAAIISGDIIQGVKLGVENFAEELKAQYRVASDFLAQLADRFFKGDRSKVVIVPGNHDVCWNTARSAMIQLKRDEEPKGVGPDMFRPGKDYRWSWQDRSVFQINNHDLYSTRLSCYWDFIEHFYAGANLRFPVLRSDGFNLFELDRGRIIVAAYESVYGNDCFCRHGAIEAGVIGKCALAIRDLGRRPILQIAVWHHSLQGPPHGDDYMDSVAVHEMIGNGFRLGLHGHQHHAAANVYKIHLPETLSMAITSAGSLCAGARELPRGTNRQYNLIVIGEDYQGARVHVREMSEGSQFGRSRQGVFSPDGYVNISWELPLSGGDGDRAKEQFERETVLLAEDALAKGKAVEALAVLQDVERSPGGHARGLFLRAAREVGKWDQIIALVQEPADTYEFMELIEAYRCKKNYGKVLALLEGCERFGISEQIKQDISGRVRAEMIIANEGRNV